MERGAGVYSVAYGGGFFSASYYMVFLERLLSLVLMDGIVLVLAQ